MPYGHLILDGRIPTNQPAKLKEKGQRELLAGRRPLSGELLTWCSLRAFPLANKGKLSDLFPSEQPAKGLLQATIVCGEFLPAFVDNPICCCDGDVKEVIEEWWRRRRMSIRYAAPRSRTATSEVGDESAKASMVPCFSVDSSGSSVSRYLGTGQFIPQPTAVTSAKPMPPAKFADRVASGALMIALPARHRRQ